LDGNHNWWQFHKVLTEKLHWTQIIEHDQDFISYKSPSGKKLVIRKSNKMSEYYVGFILQHIDLDYKEFVKFYSE